MFILFLDSLLNFKKKKLKKKKPKQNKTNLFIVSYNLSKKNI